MTIEYATEADAGAILGILAETFPGEILTRTPLGCSGAQQFVADAIHHRRSGCDVVWLVARDPMVVGFVEMRLAPRELFLNHIHVSPARQGAGMGSRLLRRSIELTRPAAADRIELSVFRDRVRQLDWYSRLSFTTDRTSQWVTLGLGQGACREWFSVGELPQADCMHARYGFSSLTLRTLGGDFRVGRLGDRYFRTSGGAITGDGAALGALSEIGPGRELVVTGVEADLRLNRELCVRHTATAVHMSAEIDRVLARLPGE